MFPSEYFGSIGQLSYEGIRIIRDHKILELIQQYRETPESEPRRLLDLLTLRLESSVGHLVDEYMKQSVGTELKSSQEAIECCEVAKTKFRALKTAKRDMIEGNWLIILDGFNAAIRLGDPNDKAFLAVQYGNRCAVFMEMQLYDEGINDAIRSLTLMDEVDEVDRSSLPSMFRQKMQRRLRECERRKLDEARNDDVTKQIHRSIVISSSSADKQSLARLAYDGEGRKMVAVRDIRPGEIIIHEKPFVSVLRNIATMSSHCDYCVRILENKHFVPCNRCRLCIYCDDECKKMAWDEYHKIDCQLRSGLIDQEQDFPSRRLALRVALKSFHVQKEYEAIRTLVTNVHLRSDEDLCERLVISYIYLQFATVGFGHENSIRKRYILFDRILKSMCSVPTNAHQLAEPDSHLRGNINIVAAGLFYKFSMFNHSCFPNILRCSSERMRCSNLVMVASRPIKEGEQLYDCYSQLFLLEEFEKRRKNIKRQYLFECQCIACIKRWPIADLSLLGTECFDNESVMKQLSVLGQQNNKEFKQLYERFATIFYALSGSIEIIWDQQCFLDLCTFIEVADGFLMEGKVWLPLHVAIETLNQLLTFVKFKFSSEE